MLPTKRQLEILRQMAEHEEDDEGEIAYERGTAYLGDTRIAPRTVFALIRLMAISACAFGPNRYEGVERYRINETGRKILGMNEPCGCGSGKKFKMCCLLDEKGKEGG